MPNRRVQVAGALSCGVIGSCCEVRGCRRSTWQRPSQVERRQCSVESCTGAGASDLGVLAGVQAGAVLRIRQQRQLLRLSAGIAGQMRLAGSSSCAACRNRTRVENNRFSDYARLGASISGARSQRGASRVCCEAARAAIRFGGQTTQDVLKCTIAPGICPKWGVELALISLSFLSPFPPFAAQVRVPGPAHWHLKFRFRYCSLVNFGWAVLCTTSYRVQFRTSCGRRADRTRCHHRT